MCFFVVVYILHYQELHLHRRCLHHSHTYLLRAFCLVQMNNDASSFLVVLLLFHSLYKIECHEKNELSALIKIFFFFVVVAQWIAVMNNNNNECGVKQ